MKAWYLDIKDDPDQGAFIVFANTRNEARSKADGHDLMYERWIDIQAVRAKKYDGDEKLDAAHLALKQWHDGWRWYDLDTPWPEECTDDEFLSWYRSHFDV